MILLHLHCGRVAVVERGPLQGRAQEWNISRKELSELVLPAWVSPLLITAISALQPLVTQ